MNGCQKLAIHKAISRFFKQALRKKTTWKRQYWFCGTFPTSQSSLVSLLSKHPRSSFMSHGVVADDLFLIVFAPGLRRDHK